MILPITLLTLLLFSVPAVQMQGSGSDAWGMYGHDGAHTSRSSANGPNSPDIDWTYTADGAVGDTVVAADGTVYAYVYITTGTEQIIALNPNGTLKWKVQSVNTQVSFPTIGIDGKIYVIWNPTDISDIDYLRALNPEDGTTAWDFDLGRSSIGSGVTTWSNNSRPTVGADGTIYAASAYGHQGYGTVFAINPNGTQKWAWDTQEDALYCGGDTYLIYCAIESSPALAPNGSLYIKPYGEGFYALDSGTGATLWRSNFDGASGGADPFGQSLTVGSDSTAYTAEGTGRFNFWAVNANNTVKWSFEAENWNDMGISALSADGSTLYRGDNGGIFYAIDTSSGQSRWRFDMGIPGTGIDGTPVLAANGMVYFTTGGETTGTPPDAHGYVYALRAADGAVIWQYEVGFGGSSLSMGPDGTLFVPGEGNLLYAFQCADGLCPIPPAPPMISLQPRSQTISSGQTATLSIGVNGTAPLTYQWYRGFPPDTSQPVGTNAYTYTTPALTATSYYWVSASNNAGQVNSTAAAVVVSSGAAPTNDLFANAITLGSFPYAITQDINGSTKSGSDPGLSCDPFGAQYYSNSLWYRYQPTSTQSITVASMSSGFDSSLLGVFTGSEGSLVPVACSNNDFSNGSSSVTFTATAGVEYHIVMTKFDPDPVVSATNFRLLAWVSTPSTNNLIASAAPLSAGTDFVELMAGSTTSPDDPTICASGGFQANTVWFSYTPPADGTFTVGVKESDFSAVLGVFSGAPGSLVPLACDQADASLPSIRLNVTAGTVYYILVARWGSISQTNPLVWLQTSFVTLNYGTPIITAQPQSQTINSGQTAALNVQVSSPTSLSYQWYQGSVPNTSNPVGTNSPNFVTPALTSTTPYWVQVTNATGTTYSSTAAITVMPVCPTFPYTVPAGDSAALISAIDCANSNGAGTNDVIDLTASTYILTAVNNVTDGENGLPVIVDAAAAGTLTIHGGGATIARSSTVGTPDFRIFEIVSGGNLALDHLTISNGRTTGYAGGILVAMGTLSLSDSTIAGNFAPNDGGGINSAGTLTVTNSVFSGNTALGLGGGILVSEGTASVSDSTFIDNETYGFAGGGGILNGGFTTSSLTVINSTFANNYADGAGGGLFNSNSGTLTLINSTIVNNQAYNGGGLWNSGVMTVTHSTISGNTVGGDGGGIYVDGGTVDFGSTIVAGNAASITGPDISGTVNSQGYNIIGSTGGATITGSVTGNKTNAASLPLNLGALANNGGLTQTMALGAGSTAINAGNPAFTPPPTTDQRGVGFPRVVGGTVDIGAFESSFVPTDVLFSDGFESGSLSAWSSSSTDGGDLSVTGGAALMGSFGMQAVIDDTTPIFVTDDTPNAEPRYRARFLFDPNSLIMANGDNFNLFLGYQGTSTQALQVQMRRYSGNYQVRLAALNDSSAWVYSPFVTITDAPHLLEIDWQAATSGGANNGALAWWLDEIAQTGITGIDNDTRRIDRVRFGAAAGIDAGTIGMLFFDAFTSRRSTYIGYLVAAPSLSTPVNNAQVGREVSPNLTWNSVAGATQYYAELSSGTTVNLNSGWQTGTTWSPGLQPQGVYTWRVKARSAGGEESAWSAARTLTVRPGVPIDLQGIPLSPTQVNLTWTASIDAPSGVTAYRVYRGGVQIGTTNNVTTTFTDNGAAACAPNQYKVRTVNSGISSLDSNVITVNTPCDPIFSDGFESGNLSAWSSKAVDGGDLAVIAGAQQTGSIYGMRARINDLNDLYVQNDTPNAEPRYRARFYFDPNTVTMANNNRFTLLYGYQGASTPVIQIEMRRSGSNYQLRAGLRDDAANWAYTSYYTISDAPHIVEVDWQAATGIGANNGSLAFWLDENLKQTLGSIDNETRRVDTVRLGAVTGIDAGTHGVVYFDAFRSTRFSYVGAEVGGLGMFVAPPEPTAEVTPQVTDEPTAEVTPEPTAVPTETPTPEPTLLPFSVPVFQTMDDGAPLWSASAGWQLSADAAYSGLGWQASASGSTETLTLTVPVNLAGASAPTLTFQSKLVSASLPEVQVSTDGTTWQTVSTVTPSLNWALVSVDLSAYAGQTVRVQFVWSSSTVDESWQVDDVTIADGTMPPTVEPTLPPAQPTIVVEPTATPDMPAVEPPIYLPTTVPREGGTVPDAPADLPPAG